MPATLAMRNSENLRHWNLEFVTRILNNVLHFWSQLVKFLNNSTNSETSWMEIVLLHADSDLMTSLQPDLSSQLTWVNIVNSWFLWGNWANEQSVMSPYPEELLGRAWVQCTVGYLCLFGQVLCALYGWHHPFHSEEGSQVGCVRGDDDEGEEPPHTSNNTSGQRPGKNRNRRNGKFEDVQDKTRVKVKWIKEHGRKKQRGKNRKGNIIKVSAT